MRIDLPTLTSPTADDERLPDQYPHPLRIDEIEAAGWGMSWLPNLAPRPAWLADDDSCLPERDSAPPESWDSWLIRASFSP